MDDKVKARLAAEFPKVHPCKPPQRWENLEEFRRLPYGYTHNDAFGLVEFRHCACGSTIGVLIHVNDLSEEIL